MTDHALQHPDSPPQDARAMLLTSLVMTLHDMVDLLPPTTAMDIAKGRQLLQQLQQALPLLDVPGVDRLLATLDERLADWGSSIHDSDAKSGNLLRLAALDALEHLVQVRDHHDVDTQSLFPSYRALVKLGGKDSAHPADLAAPSELAWSAATPSWNAMPLVPQPELRKQLDQHVLALLRGELQHAYPALLPLLQGLAAYDQTHPHWSLFAAWLECLHQGLLELDVYAKRLASRLLAAYNQLVREPSPPPADLLRDLSFFCQQAVATANRRQHALPPTLSALWSTKETGLTTAEPANASVPPSCAEQWPKPSMLPAFASAPDVAPATPLVQGLASIAQMEPDTEFLQRAEKISQQLEACISQWLAAPAQPLHADAGEHVATLSRHAWAAGYTEIATLASQMQRCFERMPCESTEAQRTCCQLATAELQRLLHQVAAGFLRRAHPQILDALHALYAQLSADAAPHSLHAVTALETPPPPTTSDLDSIASTAEELATASFLGMATHPQPAPNNTPLVTTTPNRVDPPQAPASPLPSHGPAASVNYTPAIDAMHFAVFEEEMLSVWPKLQAALKQWIKHPQDTSDRQVVLRSLHTLKGSARLAGVMAWASQVHALESQALEVPPIAGAFGPESLLPPLETLRLAFVALQQEMAQRHPDRHDPQRSSRPLETVARHAQALWTTQDAALQAVTQSMPTLQAMHDSLTKLRMQLKDCSAWADSLMLHGDMELPYEWHEDLHSLLHGLNDCTDDLGTAYQQLQYTHADAQHALHTQGGHLRALQQTLLYARLVPLSKIQERLTDCVQLASHDTFKPVEIRWQGADQLMEQELLEALTPALEHLVRNCVAHGIESMIGREAAKKPPTGRILVALRTQGQQQILSLYDDGAGLNLPAIRRKALALGLIDADTVIDSTLAAKLILAPGLSTATEVTELAGRGIGMDVVDDTIRSLNGRLLITNKPGQGCKFDIVLPAPPKVEQVMALRAGNWQVALPASCLESVRRLPETVLNDALQHGVLQDDVAGPLPVYWAGALWQQSQYSLERPLDGLRALLTLRSDTARWGVVVDEVLGTQEVTLQPPTELTVPIPGLLGTAAQPTGQVLQVYEPAAVVATYEQRTTSSGTPPSEGDNAGTVPSRPVVLLADDSLSVRRLAQHLLQQHGYRITTAADGLEALQYLQTEPAPALLIADIEMPNMDGLELLRRIRQDHRWKQLPVVMLTAHTAGPVSHKAIDLGAQAFLTKPYSPNELLAHVRRYLQAVPSLEPAASTL